MDDELLGTVASDVDALMQARSLTQRQVYEAAAVGENTISRVLRARDCRLTTLARIGRALGVEIRVVFVQSRHNK